MGMTKEEMQIAIGEACGCRTWSRTDYPSNSLPNYPEDLNAMRKAREILTPEQRAIYTSHRWKIARRSSGHIVTDDDMWKFANITATEDAEAFCRTLWPERWK